MMKEKSSQLGGIYLLSLLSGILMYIGWPTIGFFPFLFLGLIPLFFIYSILEKKQIKRKLLVLFTSFFLAHFIWIGGSLSWMYAVSVKTYFVAIILESLIFSLPFCLLFLSKGFGKNGKWFFFSFIWILMEYLNQQWSIGTPYFILGSGLGQNPWLIQIYEYIGIEGGSVFILLLNLSFFFIIENYRNKTKYTKNLVFMAISTLPFVCSLFIKTDSTQIKNDQLNISVLHTNLEPYSDENHAHPEKMINSLLAISKATSNNEELIVWPETIISNMGWLTNQQVDTTYKIISNYYATNKPKFALCLGGYAFSVNFKGKEDPYAQFEAQRGFYYNAHNVAMTYTNANLPDVRSKEIFVPFQERIPYLEHFPLMKYLADVVGANTRVSLYEAGNEVHKTSNGHKFMPILCYESIFPLFLSEKGEEIDFYVILANEYWNKNINGSEQYLYNNVAIAIQSRIPICRSSNGGISAIIDKEGNIIATKKGNDVGLLNAKVEKKTEETVYESIRGVFSKIAMFGFFTIIIIGLFQKLFLKKSNK